MPAGGVTTYTYYGNTEVSSGAITCADSTTIAAGVNQAGRLWKATSQTPGTGTAIVYETRYDILGRPVATRTGTDPWTCTSYDARGRVTKVVYPANVSAPARTVTTTYNDATDPQVVTSSDTAGTIATKTDFLGRVIEYSDVYDTVGSDKTTYTVYDIAGRVSRRYGAYVGATASSAGLEYTYDRGGYVTQTRLDGQPIANSTYTSGVLGGELSGVTYPSGAGNGTALNTISRDATGSVTQLGWTQAGGSSLFTDTVTRASTGQILTDNLDGTTTN